MTTLNHNEYTLTMRGHEYTLSKPWVMGILNVTPDSFFSDSRTTTHDAIARRLTTMISQGADIIDIGAYSTRPGADVVEPSEEIARLRQAMSVVKDVAPQALISIDTFNAQVAKVAVEELGADMINDVSGGTLDPTMPATVAQLKVPAVVMHMRGTPATMQQLTQYNHVTTDVINELAHTICTWQQAGVEQIIADPGFGFSKTTEQNYELMAHLEQFHSLNVPLLVGISRKSMIYRPLNCTPHEALNGTTVLNTMALLAGTHILRVHDVEAAVQARTLVGLLPHRESRACIIHTFPS